MTSTPPPPSEAQGAGDVPRDINDRCESCDHILGAHGPEGCEYCVDGARPGESARCACSLEVTDVWF